MGKEEAPGIEGTSQPWEPTFSSTFSPSVGEFSGNRQELGIRRSGEGFGGGRGPGRPGACGVGAGRGLPWKELLGLGTGPSIQPAPTLGLSRRREWGSDPHAQASGIFGRRGRPVFLRHRLAGARTGPRRSSASLLWASVPLSAAGSNRSCPTCLVVNGVCQNSGHLEEMESLTRQGCSFKPTPFLWRLPGLRVLIRQPLPQPGHSRLAWGRTPESTVLLGLWSTCRQVQGAWGRGWSRFHLFPPHESIKLMA